MEVGITGRDWADVLGAVEATSGVVFGCVGPDRDLAAAEIAGEFVVGVPAMLAVLVLRAVRANTSELGEVQVAAIVELARTI